MAITRKELYDLVWSNPMVQVSEKLQVPTHILKKKCHQYEVPLPKQGHWQKLRHGKKIKKSKLPPMEIEGDGKSDSKIIVELVSAYQTRIEEIKSDRALNFKVPAKLVRPHPLITKTKIALETNLDKEFGSRFISNDPKYEFLPIDTDAKQRDRALRIMNTLIQVIEKLGHKISFEYGRCHVEMFGQKTQINLRQKFNRVREKEKDGYSRESWVKTNRLEFQAGPCYDKKSWIDKKTMVLEDYLPAIIVWIEKDCRYWQELRAQQAEEKRKKDQELEIQLKRQAIIESERKKFNRLIEDARNWQRAQTIREYISEMESQLKKGHSTLNEEDIAYIDWARQKADWVDPLNGFEDQILTQREPSDQIVEQNGSPKR